MNDLSNIPTTGGTNSNLSSRTLRADFDLSQYSGSSDFSDVFVKIFANRSLFKHIQSVKLVLAGSSDSDFANANPATSDTTLYQNTGSNTGQVNQAEFHEQWLELFDANGNNGTFVGVIQNANLDTNDYYLEVTYNEPEIAVCVPGWDDEPGTGSLLPTLATAPIPPETTPYLIKSTQNASLYTTVVSFQLKRDGEKTYNDVFAVFECFQPNDYEWDAPQTYDYVPVDEFTPFDDSDVRNYVRFPGSNPANYSSWDGSTGTLTLQTKSGQLGDNSDSDNPNIGNPMPIIVQVIDPDNDMYRIRFGAALPDSNNNDATYAYNDKIFGPVVADQINWLQNNSQIAVSGCWNSSTATLTLNNTYLKVITDSDNSFGFQIYRLSSQAETGVSGSSDTLLFSTATYKNNNGNKTHPLSYYGYEFIADTLEQRWSTLILQRFSNSKFFGLGELFEYSVDSSNDQAYYDPTVYGNAGSSVFEKTEQSMTCYNYDNLWYNQPELYPSKIKMDDEARWKGNYYIPQYCNPSSYFELIDGDVNNWCFVLLDNPGQSFFNFGDDEYGGETGGLKDSSISYIGSQMGEFDLHVGFADSLKQTQKNYMRLMGRDYAVSTYTGNSIENDDNYTDYLNQRAIMPPKTIFGYYQGKYGYVGISGDTSPLAPPDTTLYVDEITDGYGVGSTTSPYYPIEGVAVDINCQNYLEVFSLDRVRFFAQVGDPPTDASVFQWLGDKGLSSQTNITPFVRADKSKDAGSGDYYEQLAELVTTYNGSELYIKNIDVDGESYPQMPEFSGTVPTDAYENFLEYGTPDNFVALLPDFGNEDARNKWGTFYQYVLGQGLSFIWQDMSVPAAGAHLQDTLPQEITTTAVFLNALKADSFNWRGIHSKILLTDPRFGTANQVPFAQLRNFYAYMMAYATYNDGLLNYMPETNGAATRERSYIILRGGYAGMQHFAGHWIGDSGTTWAHLQVMVPQILNMSLCGVPICGSDIGGFAPGEEHNPNIYDRIGGVSEDTAAVDSELLIRFLQAGTALPWFRNHYDKFKPYQELYKYTDDDAPSDAGNADVTYTEALQGLIAFRVRWHQLYYDAMYSVSRNGGMIVTPLVAYSGDATVVSDTNAQTRASRQFFIGPSPEDNPIIVSPMLRQGQTTQKIYFPKLSSGKTYFQYDPIKDRFDYTKINSGGNQSIKNIDWSVLPVFRSTGSIVPTRMKTLTAKPLDNLNTLNVRQYCEAMTDGQSDYGGDSYYPLVIDLAHTSKYTRTYTMYWDDGLTRAAEMDGKYAVFDLTHSCSISNGVQSRQCIMQMSHSPLDGTAPPDLPIYVYFRFRKKKQYKNYSVSIAYSDSTSPNTTNQNSFANLQIATVESYFLYTHKENSTKHGQNEIWVKVKSNIFGDGSNAPSITVTIQCKNNN